MSGDYFGKNLKALRENRKMTQQQLAEALGMSTTTISLWETDNRRPRKEKTLDAICELFGCTRQELSGFADGYYAKSTGLSGSISAPGEAFAASAPVLGRIAAGDPSAAIEFTDESHDLPARVRDRFPEGFFLVVKGDSMDKVLPDGCYAYIVPAESLEVQSGDVAAVKVNGDEATVKRVKFMDSVVILEPDSTNPKHRRRVIDETDPDSPYVRILGRVVWYDYEFVRF